VKDLDYFEHLEVLRKKLLWSLFVFFVMIVIIFYKAEYILKLLQYPIRSLDIKLHYLKPQEKIVCYLKASMFASIIFSFPYLLLQLVSFISPAFDKNRGLLWGGVIFSILLFWIGIAISVLFMAPFVFKFLVNFGKEDGIIPVWSIESYLNLLLTVSLAIGITFELPVILTTLIKNKILPLEKLKKLRPYIFLLSFIIGAILTPPDVLSQIIFALFFYFLFEISLILGRLL